MCSIIFCMSSSMVPLIVPTIRNHNRFANFFPLQTIIFFVSHWRFKIMKLTNRLTFFYTFVYVDEFVHYEYFLWIIVSSIVRYLFTKTSITSFGETPKCGAFSIHNDPWSHGNPHLWNSMRNKIVYFTKQHVCGFQKYMKAIHFMFTTMSTCDMIISSFSNA